MKVSNTDSIGKDSIKMLVYGPSGSGKTTLAKTLDNVVIISAEAGLLSVRDKKIDVLDITKDDAGVLIPKEKRISRLGDAYKYLNTDEAKKKYKTVFIDSLSELNQNLLEGLLHEFPERKDSLVVYGELSKRMRALVKSFRDLPDYNVVFTCLSEVEKDESGLRVTQPQLVGKFAAQLPALLDEVFYLHVTQNSETGEKTRHLVTEGTERLSAKDRSGSLQKLEVADLSVIFKKIAGQKTGENKTQKEVK